MVLIEETEAKQSSQTVAPEYLRGKLEACGLFFHHLAGGRFSLS